MAVAFDAFNAGASGTGNLSYTHTPVGTPSGVIVAIRQGDSGGDTDQVTGVTYGGAAMTEVTGSPQLHTDTLSTDDGANYVYFLGSSIPTGAQTVEVTVSGSNLKRASSITLTAGTDTEIVTTDTSVNADAVSNPEVTLSLGGRTSFVGIVFFSAHGDVANITERTGWTNRHESDFGGSTAGIYTYDTIDSTDVLAGYDASSTHAALFAFAVSEGTAVGHPSRLRHGNVPFFAGHGPHITAGWRP